MDGLITFDRNILLCLSWIFNMILLQLVLQWTTRHIAGCTIHSALSSCLHKARLAFILKGHSFIRLRKWDSCLFQCEYIYWYLSIVFIYLQCECLCYTTSLNFFNFAISLLLWISVNFCNSFTYMTHIFC